MSVFLGLKYGENSEVRSIRSEDTNPTGGGGSLGIRQSDGHRWAMRIPLQPTRNPAAFKVHLAKYGRTKPFTIPMPRDIPREVYDPDNAPAVVVARAAAADATTVRFRVAAGQLHFAGRRVPEIRQ